MGVLPKKWAFCPESGHFAQKVGILAPILNLYYTIIIHIISIFIITPARAENKKIKVIDFLKMKKERKEKKKVGGLIAFPSEGRGTAKRWMSCPHSLPCALK